MSSAAATEASPSLTTAPTLGEPATALAATTLSSLWTRSVGNANSVNQTRTRARASGIHSRSEQKTRGRRDAASFVASWQRRGSGGGRRESVAVVCAFRGWMQKNHRYIVLVNTGCDDQMIGRERTFGDVTLPWSLGGGTLYQGDI